MGNAQPNISQVKIKNTIIALAPLPEQKRIVAILDEAFEGLAVAAANAEKNLKNARDLFLSTLQAAFASAAEEWPHVKLDDLSEQVTDGTHNSPPYVTTGVPMLDSKHIEDGFIIDDGSPEKFISIETDTVLARRCKPRDGDILISSRGTIGKIAIVSAGQNFNIMGNMILVRLPECVNRRFAAFYLLSQVSAIESIAQGVAQKGLYLGQIREFKIPLPSAATQAKTAERLRGIREETERLSNNYRGKLTSVDELKQSFLQRAFAGELT